MVRTAPSHKALWEPGWPGTPGRYSCPSQQPGTPEPTRDGREAWSTGPGGGLASWSSPLPGSDSRVLTLSTCTHTSLSLGTVLAQCSPAGPPRGPGDQLACSDLWCQPTAWPWTSPALVSLSFPISPMGPWSSGERRPGMRVEWVGPRRNHGDLSGGGASAAPTLLLPTQPLAARTAGCQAAVLPGERAVLHHVAPGLLVLVRVPGVQGEAGGQGSQSRLLSDGWEERAGDP